MNTIYVMHRQALLAYARQLVDSQTDAEDLVQEAFTRFSQDHADVVLSHRAYLVRIIRNLAFNLKKRRRYEDRQVSENPPFWGGPQTVHTPEQHALVRDHIRGLAAILATMPDDTRVIVEMYRFDGYTLQEIADHLELSVTTVHRLLKAAMTQLAAQVSSDIG